MLGFPSRAGQRPLAFTPARTLARTLARTPARTLAALTLLATLAACADRLDPVEPEGPPAADDGGVSRQELSADGSPTHWADGYLTPEGWFGDTYTPPSTWSFNRAGRFGGAITVAKVAGTTGRFVATFPYLSGYLGSRSTVHVTGKAPYGSPRSYCKPAAAYLASDKVEVRCFEASTGLPTHSFFTVLVTRSYSDLAFAYAHQETATGYSPSSRGSWNPAGTTTVTRSGVGQYRVTFNNLATKLPADVMGHVQVNAVGTSNAYCNPLNWGLVTGTTNLFVDVKCYATPTGAAVDRRFTVLFTLPADHLAYALADKPTLASYAPLAAYSANPMRTPITITRSGVGLYAVEWLGVNNQLFDNGNMQVTAYGGNTICRVISAYPTTAYVECFGPNGSPVDSRFTVLFAS